MIHRVRRGYRVEEVRTIDIPEPLASYRLELRVSRVNPEVLYAEPRGQGVEILVRPLISLKTGSQKPWVYRIYSGGHSICLDATCYSTEDLSQAAPLSERSFIAISKKRGYLIEVGDGGLSSRRVDIGEILGYAPFIDRAVILLSARGLRRKILAVDQGFTYSVSAFCIERREGHSVVAFGSDGYTRVYFGADYGGYSLYDVKGQPSECSMGYRVASVRIAGKGSLYIGRGLYLETPLSSRAIAWLPEEKELLLYDERSGWLMESDLRGFKPVARIPSPPTYIGYTREAHIVYASDSILAIKGSLVVRPEVPQRGVRAISASYRGLVIDLGDRVVVTSIDGKPYRELRKRATTTCWGVQDKLLCVSSNSVGVVDLDREEEIAVEELEDEPGVLVRGSRGLLSVSLEGDVDMIDSVRDGDRFIVKAIPRALKVEEPVKVRLVDIVDEYSVDATVKTPIPEVELSKAEMVVARGGVYMKCGTPGRARLRITLRGRDRIHGLYSYRVRIRSGGRVVGEGSFSYSGEEETVDLELCVDSQLEDAELEIVGSRGGDGDPFYRAKIRGVSLEVRPEVEVAHYGGSSEISLKISPSGVPGASVITLRVLCSNTVLERSVEGQGRLRLRVAGCEAPARASILVEADGFAWIFSQDIELEELEECLRRHAEYGPLAQVRCSQGGFYRYVEGPPYEDRSPLRSLRVSYSRELLLALDVERSASFSITSVGRGLGLYRSGTLKPGINVVECGRWGFGAPLRLCIYDGTAYREYLIEPPSIEDLIRAAYTTSYKLYKILGEELAER